MIYPDPEHIELTPQEIKAIARSDASMAEIDAMQLDHVDRSLIRHQRMQDEGRAQLGMFVAVMLAVATAAVIVIGAVAGAW